MLSTQLLEELHKLSRAEKLQVIQVLAGDLSLEASDYLVEGASYAIWSPYDAPEAANILLEMLEDDKDTNG
jgi:hypothetical protein